MATILTLFDQVPNGETIQRNLRKIRDPECSQIDRNAARYELYRETKILKTVHNKRALAAYVERQIQKYAGPMDVAQHS